MDATTKRKIALTTMAAALGLACFTATLPVKAEWAETPAIENKLPIILLDECGQVADVNGVLTCRIVFDNGDEDFYYKFWLDGTVQIVWDYYPTREMLTKLPTPPTPATDAPIFY